MDMTCAVCCRHAWSVPCNMATLLVWVAHSGSPHKATYTRHTSLAPILECVSCYCQGLSISSGKMYYSYKDFISSPCFNHVVQVPRIAPASEEGGHDVNVISCRSDNLHALITFQGQESRMQVTRMALRTKSRWALSVFY